LVEEALRQIVQLAKYFADLVRQGIDPIPPPAGSGDAAKLRCIDTFIQHRHEVQG